MLRHKKILYTLLGILAVMLVLSRTQFEIRKDIEISAPPEKVWRTVIAFDKYNQWNSQLQYLGGDVKPNSTLHLKLSAKGTDPYEFKPTVSYWEENKRFAWLAVTGFPRVFDGEHFFELQDLGNGKTLVVNREEYRGLLSLIIRNLPMMKTAPEGFELMNTELKRYCEQQ